MEPTKRCSVFFSPWNHLPPDLQLFIFALLPISTLIRCATVSKSWRSLIQSDAFASFYTKNSSDEDVYFLILADHNNKQIVHSYNPFSNRWTSSLHCKSPPSRYQSSTTSLLIETSIYPSIEKDVGPDLTILLTIIDPFTGAIKDLSANPLPLLSSKFESNTVPHFDISNTPSFPMHIGRSRLIQSIFRAHPVLVNGLLLCFTLYGSQYVLSTIDPITGTVIGLDVKMPVPPSLCTRLVVFDGGLFFIGAVKENRSTVKIGIWELNSSLNKIMEWRLVCFMPHEVFVQFHKKSLSAFDIVDWRGKICFHNRFGQSFLMYDMSTKRWWCPPPPPSSEVPIHGRYWIGHAVKPCIDLVKQLVRK